MPSDTKWITSNGAHIPIEGGETKRQAVKKLRQKQNTLNIYIDPKGNSKVQRLMERFDKEFRNEPFMATNRGYSGITPRNPEKRRLYTRLLRRLDDEIEKDPRVKTKTKLIEDKSIYAMDAFYAGVRKAYDELSTAEKILYPLGLVGASYGIYKANGGIAKKLQKAYPKLHTIPAHSISGGITGGLLGGTAGAGLAYGLSNMYNKPFVGKISPLMGGIFGALGAGVGTLQGASSYLDKKFSSSTKKKRHK